MFIGHWAPALAAASIREGEPRLATLFVAAQLVDWAFFAFLLTGVEHMRVVPGITAMNPMDLYDMPLTHSLAGSAVWATGFALFVWVSRRDTGFAWLCGSVVLSHWPLDLLAHRPDLTLAGAPPKFGLGLWNYPSIEMPLELGLTFGALAFYLSRTRGPVLPAVVLGLVLALLQAVNWFGPVPDTVTPGTSFLAFLAYGIATLCAGWLGRTRSRAHAKG